MSPDSDAPPLGHVSQPSAERGVLSSGSPWHLCSVGGPTLTLPLVPIPRLSPEPGNIISLRFVSFNCRVEIMVIMMSRGLSGGLHEMMPIKGLTQGVTWGEQ